MTRSRLIPVRQVTPPSWMTAAPTRAVMAALADGEDHKALFVGGCVRNTLLGLPPGDIDIATVWTPDEVTARLQAAGLKAVPTGIAHGTVTGVAQGQPFEITTLRRDVETDGRRAVVAFTDDWREDAERRDFTMNTLLADLAGNIYDPLDRGAVDAQAGRVIFVGDPAQRIAEDYLRILRFFRFHAYYGRGAMDGAALAACRDAAGKIPSLSRERITQEFMRILATGEPGTNLKVMFENDVLRDLPQAGFDLPVLDRVAVLQRREGQISLVARLFVLAGFTVSARSALEKYLLFSNDQKREFDQIAKAFATTLTLSDIAEFSLKKLIYLYKGAALQAAFVRIASGDLQDDVQVFRAVRDWRPPVFPLTGDDAKEAGVPSGPQMGEFLRLVEQWWLDGDFGPDRDACFKQLTDLKRRA